MAVNHLAAQKGSNGIKDFGHGHRPAEGALAEPANLGIAAGGHDPFEAMAVCLVQQNPGEG